MWPCNRKGFELLLNLISSIIHIELSFLYAKVKSNKVDLPVLLLRNWYEGSRSEIENKPTTSFTLTFVIPSEHDCV